MKINEDGIQNNCDNFKPLKVSRQTGSTDTIVTINGVHVGGSDIIVIAGPCAVENQEQLFDTARSVKSSGCLLYTSDAADDLTRVDLGGGRGIEHKNEN